ncbi:MAG TPA: Rrf2 family transcriptional regulator [Marmoricola sp.]
MSAAVEWAVHCCVVLSRADGPVPAARLAEFHDLSSTYLAKQLQALARAGVVTPVEGRDGGYVLTRAAEDTSLLDVVRAVDGPEPAFRCTEIRQRGPLAAPPSACRTPCAVAAAMRRAEEAWRASLASTSVADVARDVDRHRAGTIQRAADWVRTGR